MVTFALSSVLMATLIAFSTLKVTYTTFRFAPHPPGTQATPVTDTCLGYTP
jgi:hypothetical protein